MRSRVDGLWSGSGFVGSGLELRIRSLGLGRQVYDQTAGVEMTREVASVRHLLQLSAYAPVFGMVMKIMLVVIATKLKMAWLLLSAMVIMMAMLVCQKCRVLT